MKPTVPFSFLAVVVVLSSFSFGRSTYAQSLTVSILADTLRATAFAGVANDVKVYQQGSDLVLNDAAGMVVAGPGCSRGMDASTVVCSMTGLVAAMIDLGDANDVFYAHSFTASLPVMLCGGAEDDNLTLDPVSVVGGPWHIFGDDGSDFLTGGTAADSIDGGDGDDTIQGGGGNDTLVGGAGKDQIYGDDGSDFIQGGGGNDTIQGGGGNDTLDGESGDDTIHGEDGADTIQGGGGNDTLYGDYGDDTLIGSGYVDGTLTIFGQYGLDHIILEVTGPGSVEANGQDGDDVFEIIRSDVASMKVWGKRGNDSFTIHDIVSGQTRVVGDRHDDAIHFIGTVYAGADLHVDAKREDDTFSLAGDVFGSLTFQGREGNDTVDITGRLVGPVTILGQDNDDRITLYSNVEGTLQVAGGQGDDGVIIAASITGTLNISGNRGNDCIMVQGTSGNDMISFLDEQLVFGTGTITYTTMEDAQLVGNGGDDVFHLTPSPDVPAFITGGDGSDALILDHLGLGFTHANGVLTVPNHAAISYTEVEALDLGEDVAAPRTDPALATVNEAFDGGIPQAFALNQNYPNPFNPTTAIQFALPEATPIKLAVFDVQGRLVRLLAEGTYQAGQHQVMFEASELPSGLYLYRFETPQQAFTKKMMLMK